MSQPRGITGTAGAPSADWRTDDEHLDSAAPAAADSPGHPTIRPPGRLGGWVVDHARLVTVVWLLVIVGLDLFAPRVEHTFAHG